MRNFAFCLFNNYLFCLEQIIQTKTFSLGKTNIYKLKREEHLNKNKKSGEFEREQPTRYPGLTMAVYGMN